MELIPKALVVGLFSAAHPDPLDHETVNRIWVELSPRQGYRQLSVSADAAQFMGPTPDDALLIQPPLLQFRSTASRGLQSAAEDAQVALQTTAQQLTLFQFFNLGIKHVYHATAPAYDARGFLLRRLLEKSDQDVDALNRGAGVGAGVKYIAPAADGSFYTLLIEPLLASNHYLFIDLDAQFPGPMDPERIRDLARDVEMYGSQALRRYLEGIK